MSLTKEIDEIIKKGRSKKCLNDNDIMYLTKSIALINSLKHQELKPFEEYLKAYIDILKKCIDSCKPNERCKRESLDIYRIALRSWILSRGSKQFRFAKLFFYIGLAISLPLLIFAGFGIIPSVLIFAAALMIYPGIYQFSRMSFLTLISIGIGILIADTVLILRIDILSIYSVIAIFLAVVGMAMMLIGMSVLIKYRRAFL